MASKIMSLKCKPCKGGYRAETTFLLDSGRIPVHAIGDSHFHAIARLLRQVYLNCERLGLPFYKEANI